MVIRQTNCRAMLTTEMVIAMAIIFIALIPLAYSVSRDQRACRARLRRVAHHVEAHARDEGQDAEDVAFALGPQPAVSRGHEPRRRHPAGLEPPRDRGGRDRLARPAGAVDREGRADQGSVGR